MEHSIELINLEGSTVPNKLILSNISHYNLVILLLKTKIVNVLRINCFS